MCFASYYDIGDVVPKRFQDPTGTFFYMDGSRLRQDPQSHHIVSDDTGYGDLGAYGGGEGRGMPTPNRDRLAAEGMTFFSF